MNDKHLWVGYLTQKDKQVLVASDSRVETGNPKTIFLYNQERNALVEYSKEIITPKLKDADSSDYNASAIGKAYQNALRSSNPNLYKVVFTPSSGGSAVLAEKKTSPKPVNDEIDDSDIDVDVELDIDVDDDFEESEDEDDVILTDNDD